MFEIKDFPDRQSGENVELFVRSHWWFLLWRLLPPLLLTAVTAGLLVLLARRIATDAAWVVPAGLVLLTVPLLWVAWRFALWYYDYFIITDRRVIDYVMKPFIYQQRNEAQLTRVQDVQVVFPHPIAVLLNLGHVVVQTAGMAGQLSFRYAGNPNHVQARLLELVTQARGPRVVAGPVDDLVEAMKKSLESMQPGAGASNPSSASGVAGGPKASTKPRSRTVRDLILYPPVTGGPVRVWHKHWWILLQKALLPAVTAGLGLALLILVPIQMVRAVAAAVSVGGLIWLIWRILDWYNDVYILTDDRVVDIEKVPLISEDRRETQLVMIQNVNNVQSGVIARLLGFGNVIIETAGRTGVFTFENVPNPQQVQREVSARWEASRRAPSTPGSAQAAEEFMKLLDRFYDLKGG